MPGYLLDTQIITYWFLDHGSFSAAVSAAVSSRPAGSPMYVSAITIGEIGYGHACNPAGAGTRRDAFSKFVREQLPQVLEVTRHTSEPYGEVRACLFTMFPPKGGCTKKRRAEQLCDPLTARELGIDENDLWIVAQAVERNLVLVTNDKMTRIVAAVAAAYPGFRVENWAAAP